MRQEAGTRTFNREKLARRKRIEELRAIARVLGTLFEQYNTFLNTGSFAVEYTINEMLLTYYLRKVQESKSVKEKADFMRRAASCVPKKDFYLADATVETLMSDAEVLFSSLVDRCDELMATMGIDDADTAIALKAMEKVELRWEVSRVVEGS